MRAWLGRVLNGPVLGVLILLPLFIVAFFIRSRLSAEAPNAAQLLRDLQFKIVALRASTLFSTYLVAKIYCPREAQRFKHI